MDRLCRETFFTSGVPAATIVLTFVLPLGFMYSG
jgi:hypothetical protein